MRDSEIFLSKWNRTNFMKHQNQNQNQDQDQLSSNEKSKYFSSIITHIAIIFIPTSVSPNTIALFGVISAISAAYVCYIGMESSPMLSLFMVLCLMIVYYLSTYLDIYQAHQTKNFSPIQQLFRKICDNIACVFVSYIITYFLGIGDKLNKWYLIQGIQLLYLIDRLNCFGGKQLFQNNLYDNFSVITIIYGSIIFYLPTILINSYLHIFYIFYVLMFLATIYMAFYLNKTNLETRNTLYLCLLIRLASYIYLPITNLEESDLIIDGLIATVIISDLQLASMAKRQLHPWIVFMVLASAFNKYLCGSIFLVYHIVIFYELCQESGLPMFCTFKNVYIEDVNNGHMNIISNALKYGNRIIIGIVNDTDNNTDNNTNNPVLNQDERKKYLEAFVTASKCVYEVVNCPYPRMDADFVRKYNIHVIVCPDKYDPQRHYYNSNFVDYYYRIPREMGVDIHYMSRTGVMLKQ